MNPDSRKRLFCGFDSDTDFPHICLDKDDRVSSGAEVAFDVDSI
jgi:hypothetical protein